MTSMGLPGTLVFLCEETKNLCGDGFFEGATFFLENTIELKCMEILCGEAENNKAFLWGRTKYCMGCAPHTQTYFCMGGVRVVPGVFEWDHSRTACHCLG